MNKLVFFDLDGTIINNPSSENRFIYFLMKNGHLGLKQIWECLVFLCKWSRYFKCEVLVKNKAYLTNLSVSDVVALAAQFTHQNLLPCIRPALRQCIDEHHRVGDFVVLLTGSPDFIADIFAKHLAIDELQAARFAHYHNCGNSVDASSNVATALFSNEPPLQHPYAAEKLKIAIDVCAKHRVNIADTIAYGNSIHDYALLNACGIPIAVTPDCSLRKIALSKGWKIINL